MRVVCDSGKGNLEALYLDYIRGCSGLAFRAGVWLEQHGFSVRKSQVRYDVLIGSFLGL